MHFEEEPQRNVSPLNNDDYEKDDIQPYRSHDAARHSE